MIFKSFQKITVCVFISMGLFGCSEFLNGKPAKQAVLEIKSADIICLKDLSAQFKKIIHSEATENDISIAFKCIDQTLSQFQKRVEGKESPDSFTAEELYIIFDKFYKNAKLSRQSADDFIVLKKALLGGSEARITKNEISDLRNFFIVIKTEVQKLSPYIKLYSFKKEDGPFSKLTIESGFLQLRSSLKALLAASKMAKSQYEFEDFKKLLLNLDLLQSNKDDVVDIIEKVKLLLLGTEPLRNTQDYEMAIDTFSDLMALSASVLYDNVKFEITNEKQFDEIIHFVDQFVNLLIESVQFQKAGEIKISAIDPLIAIIINKNILPFKLEAETFKSFYKKILIKVFSDQKNMSIDSLESIHSSHFKSIKKELAIFKVNLDWINSNHFADELDRKNRTEIKKQIQNYNPNSTMKIGADFDAEDRLYILNGFNDFKAEFLSNKPITYRLDKMIITANQDIFDVGWQDLTRSLYGQILARELLRGWGNSNTITEQGLVDWYTDFKLFAIELKFFDPRSQSLKTGRETFLQANLFTISGNGDAQLSKAEAFQYVNMLLTGGGQIFKEMRDGLTLAGCNLSERDAFGYFWNDEKCFYQNFKMNYKNYFSNLPYLVSYLDRLGDLAFKNYYDSLMEVARRDVSQAGRVESADIRTLNMTLLYIESLYSAYDQNKNGTLSDVEIRASYPRFRNFVTEYAHKNAQLELTQWDTVLNPCRPMYPLDSFIDEAFIFLSFNGRLPKKADLNNPSTLSNIYECGKFQLGFKSSYQPFLFTGEIDRKMIINTFKVLKSALQSRP